MSLDNSYLINYIDEFPMKYIFGAVCIFHVSALSQQTIEVFTGMYYPVTTEQHSTNNSLEKYYKPSINIGVYTYYQLTNWLNLSPSFSYNYYFYHRYFEDGYSTGERRFVAMSGEGSHIIRTMLGVQLIDQTNGKAKPYVEVGGGYIIENIGKINGYWQYPGNIEYASYSKGNTNEYFAYSVGAGISFYLSKDFDVDASVKYYSDRIDRFYYLSGFSVSYKIIN